MTERTYLMRFTKAELVALFVECNCCSDREDWESANDQVYKKLKQIGHFKKERG